MSTVFAQFSASHPASAGSFSLHGFGKILLTVLRGRGSAPDIRRELARLDLRLLDDVGITSADRDVLLLG